MPSSKLFVVLKITFKEALQYLFNVVLLLNTVSKIKFKLEIDTTVLSKPGKNSNKVAILMCVIKVKLNEESLRKIVKKL